MRIQTLVFLGFLIAPALAQEKPAQIKTEMQIKVLKVERFKRTEGSNVSYTIKLVIVDKESRLYHLQADCISSNPDSSVSCGNVSVPRAGLTYTVTLYNASVRFGTDKVNYEVDSEEVSDCK